MNAKVLIKFAVGLSLYITIWSFLPGTELIAQLASVASMGFAALISILSGAKVRHFTILEFVLFPIVVISAMTSLATDNFYSFQFSIIILLYCMTLSVITRVISLNELLDTFVYTVPFIVLTLLLTQHQEIINTLSITMSRESGLLRFTPLEMHPNITGMVYGGAAIGMAFKGLYTERFKPKMFFMAISVICVLFILAASARSSLLALIIVFIICFFKMINNLNKTRATYLFGGIGIIVFVALLYFESIFGFLSGILEFDSDTRGVDSGGTGRFELWQLGIDTILGDTSRLLFGYGLRSSEASRIGFSLESSYLTLLFEIGVFSTLLFLLLVFSAIRLTIGISNKQGENGIGPYYAIAMLMTYLVLQSVFNRYLISIGNFYSAFFLILLFRVFIEKRVKFQFGTR